MSSSAGGGGSGGATAAATVAAASVTADAATVSAAVTVVAVVALTPHRPPSSLRLSRRIRGRVWLPPPPRSMGPSSPVQVRWGQGAAVLPAKGRQGHAKPHFRDRCEMRPKRDLLSFRACPFSFRKNVKSSN